MWVPKEVLIRREVNGQVWYEPKKTEETSAFSAVIVRRTSNDRKGDLSEKADKIHMR